jgi:hypothetical protein
MDKAEWALVLSGLAIVVSGTIGVLGYRLQRQVTGIAKVHRSEELEARKRADLIARLDPPGRPKYLVLSTTGGTRATDVTVEVEPETILFQGEPTSFLALEPGQEQRVHVGITADDFPPGVPRVVVVRLRWRDDLGSQAKEMNLTV